VLIFTSLNSELQMAGLSAARARKLPTRERGQVRVRALLEAAEVVFANVGYEGATMKQIAHRAGAPIGSLYQFFPSKEAIGIALIDQYLQQLAQEWSRLASGLRKGAVAKLCRSVTATTRKFIESRTAYHALDSITARTTLQPEGRTALLAELQMLIAKIAPDCRFADRTRIAATLLQLVKSEYALDHLVEPHMAQSAREEMCYVMESYLHKRLDL
jgi:AcrR family transcriptional regulator